MVLSNFDRAIGFILEEEGGYNNLSSDKNGETNWGISKKSYPHLDIKNLSRDAAIEIYRRDHWNIIKGDSLPELVSVVLMDMSVNHGSNKAILMFQEVIGAKQDGRIGVATLIKLNEMIKGIGEKKVCLRLIGRRAKLYIAIAKRQPSQMVFLSGWIVNRLFSLIEEIV